MNERTGIVFSQGKELTLLGNEIKVGDVAPDFETVGLDMKPVTLSSLKGKVVVLSTVPSLDTQICDIETKRFNTEAKKKKDVVFLTTSMDLPTAQKRWATEAGAEDIRLASDHRAASMGLAYGVLLKDLRLLARAVFIIGKDGKVKYIQYVKELGTEPDYDEVMAALKEIVQ